MDPEGDFAWFIRTVLWAYSGSRDFMTDARFRPMSVPDHRTSAFPPAFISSGSSAPLAPQAKALARRLKAARVTVDSLLFPTDHDPPPPHEYQFNLDTQAGQEALDRLLAFVAALVAR